jgi:hypothetical protein
MKEYCGGHKTELNAYYAVIDRAEELGVDLGKYAKSGFR